MHNPPDILSLAYRQSVLQDQFTLLQEKVRLIPGSVQYTINMYNNSGNSNIEDMVMLVYNFEKRSPK